VLFWLLGLLTCRIGAGNDEDAVPLAFSPRIEHAFTVTLPTTLQVLRWSLPTFQAIFGH
jgi:hypothetical protein